MWGDECYVTAFLMEINTSYIYLEYTGGDQIRTDNILLTLTVLENINQLAEIPLFKFNIFTWRTD